MPFSWYNIFIFSGLFMNICMFYGQKALSYSCTNLCVSLNLKQTVFAVCSMPLLFCLWGAKLEKSLVENCEGKQMDARDVWRYVKVRKRENELLRAWERMSYCESEFEGPFSSCEGWNSWTWAMKCICLLSLILFHIIQRCDLQALCKM